MASAARYPAHVLPAQDWICLLETRSIAIFFVCLMLLAVAMGAALIAFGTMGAR